MKRFRYPILIILLSLIPFIHMFLTPDLPHTSDGEVQIPRFAAYYKAMSEGHFPVRWAGYLNYGYGLPVFNFMYHTPYLIASGFIALGIKLVTVFKLVLLLSFLLSGVFMYVFSRELLKDEAKAFLMTMMYQYVPFRLEEIILRGAVGSIYVYAFLPLVLWGLLRIIHGKRFGFFITSLATAFMVISHNALSLLFFGLSAVFLPALSKNRKSLFTGFLSLMAGLGLSLWYAVPVILEHKYTYGNLFMKELYKNQFKPLTSILLQPLRIPGSVDPTALRLTDIEIHIGIIPIIVFVFGIILFCRSRNKKTDGLVRTLFPITLAVFGMSIFFMHPVSLFIWEHVPLLRQFQFPWRFMGLMPILMSFGMLPLLSRTEPKKHVIVYTLLTFLLIGSTYFYFIPPLGYDRIADERKTYWDYPLTTTYYGETDVIWSEGPAKASPQSRIELIGGEATISGFTRSNHTASFDINARNDSQILANIQYFPGWRAMVDNKNVPIEFQDINHRGLITFYVPKGLHDVKLVFGESKIRLLADGISLATLLSLLSYFGIGRLKKGNPKKYHT